MKTGNSEVQQFMLCFDIGNKLLPGSVHLQSFLSLDQAELHFMRFQMRPSEVKENLGIGECQTSPKLRKCHNKDHSGYFGKFQDSYQSHSGSSPLSLSVHGAAHPISVAGAHGVLRSGAEPWWWSPSFSKAP